MFFINLSQGRFDFSHQRLNTGVKDKTDRGGGKYIYSQMSCFPFCTYSTNTGPFSNVAWRPLRVLWVVGKQVSFHVDISVGERGKWSQNTWEQVPETSDWRICWMKTSWHVTLRACHTDRRHESMWQSCSHHSGSGSRKHGWNLRREKPPKVYMCLRGCYFFYC